MNTSQQTVYDQATDCLQRIFQAESTAHLEATIQFVLTGEDEVAFVATIHEQTLSLAEGKIASPKVTMSMEAHAFLDMIDGKLSTTDAFTSGMLKVGGNLFYAMKLAPVFKFGKG